jgi:two-component system response regulator YesN
VAAELPHCGRYAAHLWPLTLAICNYGWAAGSRLDPDEFIKFSLELTIIITDMLPAEVPEQEIAQKLLRSDSAESVISMMVYCVSAACQHVDSYQMKKAKQLIDERLRAGISLRSVSEEVGLSPNYFSRIFAEQTGESFTDYVTRRRMEKAVTLLTMSEKMVYEIAEEVGIPNYRYFSSVFKNWTGHTPKEYRNK